MECHLINGTSFSLDISLVKLYAFRATNKETYQKFNKIIINGPGDVFDMVTLLYTCYLINSLTKELTLEDFINNLTAECQSLSFLTNATNKIMNGTARK